MEYRIINGIIINFIKTSTMKPSLFINRKMLLDRFLNEKKER